MEEVRSIKILHTADLHLDSPFEALSAEKAMTRRREQRILLSRIAALANSSKADIVLLSGDILDGEDPYFETAEELCACLRRINAPVFISPGNHDFYSPSSPYAHMSLPDNVHLFTSDKIECVSLPDIGAAVYGAAFTDKTSRPLLKGFSAGRTPGIINIMCIHGEVGTPDSRYNPMSEEDIASSGMDYIALGHVHAASGLKKAGNTFYSQPGCPEGRGFDECGEKTVNMIELSEGECRLDKVSIASRKYEQMEIDITGTDPAVAIQLALPDDTIRDIYRITLKGEASSPVNIHRLETVFLGLFFALQLIDKTVTPRDIWESAGEDTLRGIFLKKLRESYDSAPTAEQKQKIELAARYGIAALDNMEEPCSHED